MDDPSQIRTKQATAPIPGAVPDDEATRHVDIHMLRREVSDQGGSKESTIPCLVLVRGGTPGFLQELEPGTNWLGRSRESRIPIRDLSVSRLHAAIEVDPAGVVTIADLKSSNGTFLNGNELEEEIARELRDGDLILLGSHVTLKYHRLSNLEIAYHRELFQRTIRDPLTGLHNRTHAEERLAVLRDELVKMERGMGVALLDIDHFKKVNDQCGHEVGDHVLRWFADILRGQVGPDDTLARFGGEEFLIVMPNRSLTEARDRMEKLRAAIAARPFLCDLLAIPIPITASVGLLHLSAAEAGFSTRRLLRLADQLLYQAKNRGRNRVIVGVVTGDAREPDEETNIHPPGPFSPM